MIEALQPKTHIFASSSNPDKPGEIAGTLLNALEAVIHNIFERKRQKFLNHITTAEINAKNLVHGWGLFHDANWTENWIENRWGQRPSFHISLVIQTLYFPGKFPIDTTTASLAHFTLRTCCLGLDGNGGPYLEGLEGKDLEQAIKFCKAMDGVGWEEWDVYDMYPIDK